MDGDDHKARSPIHVILGASASANVGGDSEPDAEKTKFFWMSNNVTR